MAHALSDTLPAYIPLAGHKCLSEVYRGAGAYASGAAVGQMRLSFPTPEWVKKLVGFNSAACSSPRCRNGLFKFDSETVSQIFKDFNEVVKLISDIFHYTSPAALELLTPPTSLSALPALRVVQQAAQLERKVAIRLGQRERVSSFINLTKLIVTNINNTECNFTAEAAASLLEKARILKSNFSSTSKIDLAVSFQDFLQDNINTLSARAAARTATTFAAAAAAAAAGTDGAAEARG